MFWVKFIYYSHWILDIAFVVACLSVAFKPVMIARLYVTAFLAQQLILNGCIMTWLENQAESAAGLATQKNEFIMSQIVSEPVASLYRVVFLVIIAIQVYYIYKEYKTWKQTKKAI